MMKGEHWSDRLLWAAIGIAAYVVWQAVQNARADLASIEGPPNPPAQ